MSGPVLVDVLAVSSSYREEPWQRDPLALAGEIEYWRAKTHRLRFWAMALAFALASSISTGLIGAVEHGREAAELRARCMESGR